MKRILLVVLMLAGCHRAAPQPETPGDRLEAAATAAGLVTDARGGSLIGTWARDTDRLCIVPGEGKALRIGLSIDYGPGQQCAGRGIATRSGEKVQVTFGRCVVDARFDGSAITFPVEVPDACESLCSGRASLAAMRVERLSGSRSEAAAMRSPGGKPLCER